MQGQEVLLIRAISNNCLYLGKALSGPSGLAVFSHLPIMEILLGITVRPAQIGCYLEPSLLTPLLDLLAGRRNTIN